MGFIRMPLLAMPVLHKYIPALILNNNYQSILGRSDILTEKPQFWSTIMIRRNVRNLRHSGNRLMLNCNRKRRNIRRFESVSLGEALYNEVTRDLSALEERVQNRFEDICKNEYHYKRVNGNIAVEDGGETDDGNPMLCFYLFDKKGWNVYMTYGDSRDSLSEVNYSFQIDGFYEDDEYFCGTTEKDLIEAVAEKFARDFDSLEH